MCFDAVYYFPNEERKSIAIHQFYLFHGSTDPIPRYTEYFPSIHPSIISMHYMYYYYYKKDSDHVSNRVSLTLHYCRQKLYNIII